MPGARTFPVPGAFAGPNPSIYAYSKVSAQRNIYRVPVLDPEPSPAPHPPAPEQARGIPVDRRADIWAFGVVLFEMVTGERLFQGQDVTETLASVVKDQPDFSRVPAKVRKLLARCLEKDPKKRLRDIGDAWALLEEPAERTEVLTQTKVRATQLPWAIAAAVMLALAAALFWLWPRTVERPLIRLSADLGPDAVTDPYITAAISPDGSRIVFPMHGPGGKQQLATRVLAQTQAALLPN